MTFQVAAESYDRFMGRYSVQLSAQLADLAGVTRGQRVVDVGCGPGALTTELVSRLGADAVAAVDPSEPFVEAARERHPGVDVRLASAESLPYDDGVFDAALAQLVVHFMTDPVAGIREMRRVTVAGGPIAACVWDLASDRTPLGVFWAAVRDVDPGASDESELPGAREGHLRELFGAAGVGALRETVLEASLEFQTFDEWWEPFTFGVGPAGAYAAGLDPDAREALRARCERRLPPAPFTIRTAAWAVCGSA